MFTPPFMKRLHSADILQGVLAKLVDWGLACLLGWIHCILWDACITMTHFLGLPVPKTRLSSSTLDPLLPFNSISCMSGSHRIDQVNANAAARVHYNPLFTNQTGSTSCTTAHSRSRLCTPPPASHRPEAGTSPSLRSELSRAPMPSRSPSTVVTITPVCDVSRMSLPSYDDSLQVHHQHINDTINNNGMPFHGLPVEILHYIALFLPFHDLVKVYQSLPLIHRPLFQQPLDHALALMVLTLDIEQQPQESSCQGLEATRAAGLAMASATLSNPRIMQSQWRVTHYDLETMRIEFELEEKLALQMAEQRRQEIQQQHQDLASQSRNSNNAITSGCSAMATRPLPLAGSSVPMCATIRSESLPQHKQKRAVFMEENIESIIWKSRRRSHMEGSFGQNTLQHTNHDLEDRDENHFSSLHYDSNFFHCLKSAYAPILSSAKVSFKAHRNTPAPWIMSRPVSATSPSTAAISLTQRETARSILPRVQSAIERTAAFQQNEVLMRSLKKIRSLKDSETVQFLPKPVSLDTRDLGRKQSTAVRVHKSQDARVLSAKGRTSVGWTETHQDTDIEWCLSKTQTQRRHSWQEAQQLSDWPSVVVDMMASWTMAGTLGRSARLCRSEDDVVITTTLTQGFDALKEVWGSINNSGRYEQESRVRGSSSSSSSRHENQGKLFEFTYDIRHNYLMSSRVEGERVVRPIRFTCSLDLFARGAY